MRRVLACLVACACLGLLLTAGGCTRAARRRVHVGRVVRAVQDVNGQLVQSEPETSGAFPIDTAHLSLDRAQSTTCEGVEMREPQRALRAVGSG